jgi:hypothetical protein
LIYDLKSKGSFYYPTRFYNNLFRITLFKPAFSKISGSKGPNIYQYSDFVLGDDEERTLRNIIMMKIESE